MVLLIVSLRNTSPALLVSFATRLFAYDSKAIYLPSDVILGCNDKSLACHPALLTLILVVVPLVVSLTKISALQLVSLGTKFVAWLTKTTYLQLSDK